MRLLQDMDNRFKLQICCRLLDKVVIQVIENSKSVGLVNDLIIHPFFYGFNSTLSSIVIVKKAMDVIIS